MSAKVISFSSGKGGVGKTTLVVNLGSHFAASGKRTLLIDGDWTLGKLGIMLGARPEWTVEKVLNSEVTLEEAICPVRENLSFLASPSGVLGFEELDEATRNKLYFELEKMGDAYDIILFDHASGISPNVLQFAAASDQQIIVTTPEPTSYTDAYAIMKILSKRFGIQSFSLIVTQSTSYSETRDVITRFSDVVLSHLNVRVKLVDILPWDSKVSETIRKRQIFLGQYPGCELTLRLKKVCEALAREEQKSSHGLSFFLNTQPYSLSAR